MYKQTRVFLLTIHVFVVFFLYSQELYAGTLHFIAYGDTRRNIETLEKPQTKHNAIAKVIREMDPDFILLTGDMVYYNEFEKFLEVITNNYAGNKIIPFYPVIGNHELTFGEKVDATIKELLEKIRRLTESGTRASLSSDLSDETARLWMKLHKETDSIVDKEIKKRSRWILCEEIRNKLNPEYISYLNEIFREKTKEQSWYSFTREVEGLKIKFIALNSSLPDDEEQYQWFLTELHQFHGPKVVFEHYPPYSIGFHGCYDLIDRESKASRFRDRYTKFFNDAINNVILVINGHEHNYQRICRTDETGNIQLPIYIISGGGGADLSGQGECDISQIPLNSFQCLKLVTAYHFVDIVIHINDKNTLVLKCRVPGIRYDTKKGLPDDESFEKEFIKERLELIDDFTVNWQK
jgi:hypothetical protein